MAAAPTSATVTTNVIYAHRPGIPRARALGSQHVMIERGGDSAKPDKARLSATIRLPDGPPGCARTGTVCTTPEHGRLRAEAEQCARAVAQWLADPGRTAETMLLAELAGHGITPDEQLSIVRSTTATPTT